VMERAHPSAEQPARRQFGMRAMLGFVAACAAYFAALTAMTPVWGLSDDLPDDFNWPLRVVVPVLFAWVLLRYLYGRWELRGAVKVLYTGPITILVMLVLVSPWLLHEALAYEGRPDLGELFAAAVVSFTVGCGASVLVSLPAAVLMMVRLGTR
jgi:hypothetical protein